VSAISRSAIIRRPLALGAAVATLCAVAPAAAIAAGTTSTTSCNAPALAQVYSWALDTNWYAGIPGESWDNMGTSGWTLSGGAKFMADTLADGARGNVLYMPSGSKAVTPQLCISDSYPFGRGEMRNLAGTQGVSLSVSYLGSKGWGASQATGSMVGTSTVWSLPSPFTIKPSSVTGWQYAKFTLTALGSSSKYEISNLYIDPRMH
jgi:hypothetical protein